MNLYDYFKKNVCIDKIKSFEGDMYDLAVVRYVMKEAARIFYRDYTFFLDKENVNAREGIYNREHNPENMRDYSIVCKSYCDIIKDVLKENFGLTAEMISPDTDRFRHVDLLIMTSKGNRYIVDPLTDLLEMQLGLRTNNFASLDSYKNTYAGKVENISFLSDEDLEKIDDKIHYTMHRLYLNDFFDLLRTEFEHIEDYLEQNEELAIELLGKKYEGQSFSEDEKIQLKLEYISKYLNNRKTLNGFVELIMFSKLTLEKLFSQEELKKICTYSFFVDEKDLKDEKLNQIMPAEDTRKRGFVFSFKGQNYIFSLGSTALKYSDEEWKKIIDDNNIFIKQQYPVQLLKYLKSNNADRNILHNNEFLRLFSEFETSLLEQGIDIETIKKEYIFIQDGVIYTRSGENMVSYKIEDGNLVIKNFSQNLKTTVYYKDEGRNISYKTEPILQENQKVHLWEFDSNGLIILDEASGIEDLVAPLKNGKYLSRNVSFYSAKTYSELAEQRKHLGSILTEDVSKKNFVILEYLANASAKVYFEELKKKIKHEDNHAIEAQRCFGEDCANIVRFFENNPLRMPEYDLPEGDSQILERHIEMDNKQILFLFCSSLKFNKPKHVITPGLGSIFVGPILKSMYGFEYTNILFSLYSKDEKLRDISSKMSFEELFSNDLWLTTSNELMLIDDNVGSCNTMNTIRRELAERGKSCLFGAIKYNWEFYQKVKKGELDHPTFPVNEVDFLTIIDDPGYWIMRDSIKALKEEGGDAYVEVVKKEGLHKREMPDIEVLMNLAEKYSQEANVDLYNAEHGQLKRSSIALCRNLKNKINELVIEMSASQDWSRDE